MESVLKHTEGGKVDIYMRIKKRFGYVFIFWGVFFFFGNRLAYQIMPVLKYNVHATNKQRNNFKVSLSYEIKIISKLRE